MADYVPLCEPWPLPASGCPDLTGPAPVTGSALLAASQDLWALSGHQFGNCEVTLRPCRADCGPRHGLGWWGGWPAGAWPLAHGTFTEWWWSATCGRCRHGCGCTDADELLLPDRARSVTEVLVDGEVLPEGTGWLLWDGRRLVRTDGERWPLCQDWTVTGGPGTWSVTAVYGSEVPESGRWAVWQLAAEYAKWCQTGECKLPGYTTTVTRQGVTQTFPSIVDLVEHGLTGLALVDRFLDTWNPDRLRGSAQVWNPDDFDQQPRHLGGWP